MRKGLVPWKLTIETFILGLFICCGPFFRGYIFENGLAIAAVSISLGFMYFLPRSRQPRDTTLYALMALSVIYAASIGYGDDHREALDGFLAAAMLTPLYSFARSITRQRINQIWTIWVWLTGLSVLLGTASHRFVEGRLVGFIDYANGYAILLLIGIIMCFALKAGGASLFRAKWMQVPIFLDAGGIYLTESRTVFVLLLASFILLFFWSKRTDPLFWFRSSGNAALGIATAVAYDWSPWMAIPAVVVFGLGCLIPDGTLSRRAIRITLLAAAPLFVLPSLLGNRGIADRWSTLGSRTGEGFVRLVYDHDAWSLFKDAPIFGFGAGGWANLQYRYQTADYFTAYVHSLPLQIMTEVGFVGFLIITVAITNLLLRGFLAAKKMANHESGNTRIRMMACCMLLVHSLVDFTLSFPYFLGLLFIIGAAPEAPVILKNDAGRARIWKPIAFITGAGTIVIASLLIVSNQFEQSADRAIAENRKADAVRLLEKSASTSIFADRIYDRKARLYLREYNANGDQRYLDVARIENEKALSVYPDQIWYRKTNSDILWQQGNKQKSIVILSKLVQDNRFIAEWREELEQKEAKIK
ncbi:O-antigen ligase family protein [Paenibacillus sacheonensis]|uniref:O-antigen ligase-related domain-containing protein n=1 Tax=Paenibacillus sacheonensis TaxID=742054 RepID=A0A7X5BZ04_9BACL|nr:O-antigen ligase family protein [Paenibacillus sacheonensis]NBC70202.1 hypothetical protein [Paenibacillus sacheonensis]